MTLLSESGEPLAPSKLYTWYSEGKDAEKLFDEKLAQILKAYSKTHPNGKVKMEAYGKRANEITVRRFTIDGIPIAKVTYIAETESGNPRIEVVTPIDINAEELLSSDHERSATGRTTTPLRHL